MRLFHWLGASELPAGCDLRRRGWVLVDDVTARVALALSCDASPAPWPPLLHDPEGDRARVLLLGVSDPSDRARFLRLGYGDVVGEGCQLAELEARALRLAKRAHLIPASRKLGPLKLDLLARDGFVGGRALGLHPREFALAWRLADSLGAPMSKAELLHDVWRLGYLPETNSLAVHIFRLRAKLAIFGLRDVVRTVPGKGYVLADPESETRRAIPLTIDSPFADDTLATGHGATAEDSLHELHFHRE